jgi:hypothetical protein
MAQLAPEEMAILDILIEGRLARERVPVSAREIVSASEKYAFPIGIDEAGSPFPIPRRRDDEEDA